MKKGIDLRTALFLILFISFGNLFGAWITDMPVTEYQPDGKALELFASGDEYHNWLQDKDGYTIIREKTSGELRYAEQDGEQIRAGRLVAGLDDPRLGGLTPGINISRELYKQARETKFARPETRDAPTTGQFNNLVVFIRFSDEAEYGENISLYNGWFNSNASSLKNYFLETSYNQLNVDTHFYPAPVSGYVVSWQDSHPRSYFQPYDATTNPNGYNGDDERRTREFALLAAASSGVSPLVPSNLNIDADGDGRVDNVVFIVKGSAGAWNSLLWPHRWSLWDRFAYIRGKRVYDFNFQLQNYLVSSNVGVLCHEFYHSLGAPDLYHYSGNGIAPAGTWDVMNSNTNPPQHMTTHMKMKYGGWVSSIPTISGDGEFSLNPATSPTGQAYRINSNVAGQHYIVEFRKKTGIFESSIPGSGIIVYRIDTSLNGNADGPPDELYVYRPGGSVSENGSPSEANFSAETGRTMFSNLTNPSPFLQDGSQGNLKLYAIGSAAGNTITFKTGEPEPVIWDFSQAEYRESFESGALAEGWINVSSSGTYIFEIVSSGSMPTCYPVDGSRMLMYNSYSSHTDNGAQLISPNLRITDTASFDYNVRFNMYRDSGYINNADRIELWVYGTGSNSTMAILVGTVNRSINLSPAVTGNGWYDYEFTLPIADPGDYVVCLKAISGYGNRMYLDNLRIGMKTILPYSQSFAGVVAPALPVGNGAMINSTSTYAYVKTISSSTYSHSAPMVLAMNNSSDAAADVIYCPPVLPIPLNTVKTRFWARSSGSGYPLKIGSIDGTGNFLQQSEVNLSTTYQLYEVNFAGTIIEGDRIAFKHGLGGTSRTIYIDDIEIMQIPAYDLCLDSIGIPPYSYAGEEYSLQLNVRNAGSTALTGYQIRLFDADTQIVLSSSVINTEIPPGATRNHNLSYQFSSPGMRRIYLRVSHPQDTESGNNNSIPKPVCILPEDTEVQTMGSLQSDRYENYLPFNFYYKNNVSETIYYPGEGLIPGSTLYAISYPYSFVTALSQTPLKIWMQNTESSGLSSGWLPAEGYQLVFDGLVDIPAGEGELFIPLAAPFLFEGSNLAIRVNRPMDSSYYSSSDKFCLYENTSYSNRSRRIQSDSVTYDPLAPGVAGTVDAIAPKISFYLQASEMDVTNLTLTEIFSPLRAVAGLAADLEIQILNSGNTEINSLEVMIRDYYSQELLVHTTVSTEVPAGEAQTIQVPITFTETGQYFIQASVVVEDESYPEDNTSLKHKILVVSPEISVAEIGGTEPGTQLNSIPFNFFYKNSVTESIYLAEELGTTYALITGMEYYHSFVDSLVARPVKIWLKNTGEQSLSSSFPIFEGYTLVFDSVVNFIPGERSLYIEFPEPYLYTGANLAVRANRVMDTSYYSSADTFEVYDTGGNRSIFLRSDSTVYDPVSSLEGAIVITQVPKIALHHQDVTLAAPELQITQTDEGFRLDWQAVEYANKYVVYVSSDLLHWVGYESIENWFIYPGEDKAFFKVVADTEAMSIQRGHEKK